jgi:LuxR family maltose regulon positive regulatory protein
VPARFARTKIQPPRPREGSLIARPALEARLAEALASHRLVLVCAAAGYGKTSALARQLERLPPGHVMAWVSADEGDDLQRLLECLFAALEPFDPPWRSAPEALVAAAAEPQALRAVATELINTLDACDVVHGVIVLDDLHRVTEPAWFVFLDLLLERLSPRWTMAVASRDEPPLALARLRARGELAEFRQHDLAFERGEVQSLLAAAGGLDGADALFERTRGWPAGLRLALNVRGDAPRTAIDRTMFEFLAAEVIDRLEPELREFLLRTSVLPELSADRCAAVSGNLRSAALLEEVERRGLFVSVLDPIEPTLRLHDLFRDALQHRLARERPDELHALCERAAQGEPDTARRITLLLRAGRVEAAAHVLLEATPALLTDGALASVAHLAAEFPAGAGECAPLLHARGLLAWAQWNFAPMVDCMRRAEAGWRTAGDDDRARQAAGYRSLALNALGHTHASGERLGTLRREAMGLETRVVVLVACLWHALDLGSLHRVGPLLDELVDTLEPSTDLSLWYRAHPLPRLNGLPGTGRALERYVDGVLRLTVDKPTSLRAMALSQRAWREAWTGRLDDATATLALARADAQWLGNPVNVTGSLQLLDAVLAALRGDRDAAIEAARRLIDEHPATRGPWSLWGNLFYAARIAAAFGERALLARRLAQLETRTEMPLTQTAVLQPLRAQAAWLDGRVDDALALWRAALDDEARIDRLGHSLEARLRLAAALAALRRIDEAAATLSPVFDRVADHAGLGPVLFARDVLPTLVQTAWGDRLPPAQRATLGGWLALVAAPAPQPPPHADMALSARELEVLERIAAGDSNKLIARAFDLSPHTVKRHVANILDKLGVDSRGQAAALYRGRPA